MEEREEEEEKEEEEKTIPIVAKQSYPLADGISRNERQGDLTVLLAVVC